MKRALILAACTAIAIGLAATAPESTAAEAASDAPAQNSAWTCSMHPQIRLPGTGMCPLCGMPLVSAVRGGAAASAPAGTLTLDDHALRMAQVATAVATRKPLIRRLRALGVVDYNEAGLATIPTRVGGYIERLFVNQTGVPVAAGDHLAEIYSPDLIVAQQELLVAKDRPEGRLLADAARARLRRFGISEAQIAELERSAVVQERLTLNSPIAGVVVEKMVTEQAPVESGMVLFRIANLESVWVQLAIHEQDLELVRPGQSVEIRSDAYPGEILTGRVAFIDPVLDPMSRTARARVVVANPGLRLKPNLYVTAGIAIPLRADGAAGPTGVEGRWSCPMHPEVLDGQTGGCPRCGMALQQMPGSVAANGPMPLAVPTSAVLLLGDRAIVWREDAPGVYRALSVRVGAEAGDDTIILEGVSEGDRVVARGGFLIDSEAQIRGLPSLMNPQGSGGSTGHQHGGAVAPPAATAPAPGHQH
jgi:Cu(I)/Ag(I) efflux system membrane fusion protein